MSGIEGSLECLSQTLVKKTTFHHNEPSLAIKTITPSNTTQADSLEPSLSISQSEVDAALLLSSKCNFRFKLRQQPLRGRMCGFSAVKDRRIIDPPLVLQLVTLDNRNVLEAYQDFNLHILCHISLWSADRQTDCSAVINPRYKSHNLKLRDMPSSRKHGCPSEGNQYCQTIIGTTSTPPQVLMDLDGTPGLFFVFYDLSVRVQGDYTLKCQLFELDSTRGNMTSTVVRDVIFTNPFHMYSPKYFPGMGESTELSKCFARQGISIHIRRDYSGEILT
ncbi:hypothetical protein BDV3_000974 [Batrachochytrium dendrobatidis]|nr:hypothetical protein O5D80_005977 [Batrachochytrium dendrobatidis]